MKELKDKINKEDSANLNESLDKLKKSKESNNPDEIKKSLDSLNSIWSKISENVYKQKQNQQSGPEQPADNNKSKKKEQEVKDADFEVVEEDDKKN